MVRGQLQSESDDHDALHATVRLVFDDLGVTSAMETSSLVVRVTQIPDWALAVVREALHTGVHRAFAIARSHYINIDLPVISEGFTPSYTDAELDEIEVEAELPMQGLVRKFKEDILPKNV